MDPDDGRIFAIKKHLKSLPVWKRFDEFKAEFLCLEYETKSFLERLDSYLERANKLPISKGSKKSVVQQKGDNVDVEVLFKKTDSGYTRCDNIRSKGKQRSKEDPLKDESVLMLEELVRGTEEVYALDHPEKPWIKCRIVCVSRRPIRDEHNDLVISIRLKTLDGTRVLNVDKYGIARIQFHSDKLRPTKRIIAGLSPTNLMPGIIGHEPSELNKNRYLVLMDDGSSGYFNYSQVFPILAQSPRPWTDQRHIMNANSDNEAYCSHFFSSWPKRHLIQISVGETFELLRNNNLVSAKVTNMDCDVMTVRYKDNVEESLYRGSARLLRRSDVISKQLASMKVIDHMHNKLIMSMHQYYQAGLKALNQKYYLCMQGSREQVIAGRGQTARKSTAKKDIESKYRIRLQEQLLNDETTVKEWDSDYFEEARKSHKCSPLCHNVPNVKTETSVRDVIDEFRSVSDLTVPLLLGWKRNLYRIPFAKGKIKIGIAYQAPCGKFFKTPHDTRRYLMMTNSILDVDYFSFDRDVLLNRPIDDIEAIHYVANIAVDATTRKPLENKNISLVNLHSEEQLPDDFEYRNDIFPHPVLKSKNFSLDYIREFKSSCECEDDCVARPVCPCHMFTQEAYGKQAHHRGIVEVKCQYSNKRLPYQVSTGIFECNSYCNCSSKCSNRVVQNGIRFRLQVRKTLDKGWGVISLDDIPKGAFICTYSAELLDDADLYGDCDMYYADLDYITVNERQKGVQSDSDEGVEVDDESEEEKESTSKKNGKKPARSNSPESDSDKSMRNVSENSISSLEDVAMDLEEHRYVPSTSEAPPEPRYPKRRQQQQLSRKNAVPEKQKKQPYRKIHDILGGHDYTLDARMQGNVGRFFNHSCDPNSFVQNVFIETHDLRFPTVSFFASRTIKALDEITWNYNYMMGSIEGRRIECRCNASNCKGRIL